MKDINLDKFKDIKHFFFISPHLDDAILSCGLFIKRLVEAKKDVTVITLFTKANNKVNTPLTKQISKNSSHKNSMSLFLTRKNEDIEISKFMKIKYKHLGLVDAPWRTDSLGKALYKTEKDLFSGKVKKLDNKLIIQISNKIKKIAKHNGSLILFPIGIGNHVDHVITKRSALLIKDRKLFYEDYPYNNLGVIRSLLLQKDFKTYFKIISKDSSEKKKLVKFYDSQYKILFPSDNIPNRNESFYQLRTNVDS